jgi:competence protein ComEC
MSGVWFYAVILSFASGVFLRSFFDIGTAGAVWLLVVSGGLLAVTIRTRDTKTSRDICIAAVVLLGITVGIFRYELKIYLTPASLLQAQVGENITVVGQVVREPEERAKVTHLTVAVLNEKILVQTDRHSPVRYGDTVSVTGKLTEPDSFVTDLGREFDYGSYLKMRGVTYTMAFAEVTVTDITTGNWFLRYLFALKSNYIAALDSVIPEPAVALGKGLILGVKQALGETLETDFRRAGIIHIVVLSGYNIMIMVNFAMLFLAFLLPLRARVVLGICVIGMFAVVVGGGASVVRASIMAAIALLALRYGRRYAIMRALFAAGFVMVWVNPLVLVHDIGFQLSFMATLGLILVAPQFETVLTDGLARIGIKEYFVATVATQIAVLPILLYHMGEFSLVAVVVNILVLPIVPLAMLATFMTGLVALASVSMALPFAYIAYALLTYIMMVATYFAHLPMAAVSVPAFPFVLVVIAYGVLGYWLYRRMVIVTQLPALALPTTLAGWTIERDIETSVLTKKEL